MLCIAFYFQHSLSLLFIHDHHVDGDDAISIITGITCYTFEAGKNTDITCSFPSPKSPQEKNCFLLMPSFTLK